LVETFWNFAFGVNANTGNGKLDGDTVTEVSKPTLNQECGAYALTFCGCNGTYVYGFGDGTAANAARIVVTKAGDPTNVLVKDMLFYTNGTVGLGYHFTAVATVNAKKPQKLQWKFQWSGVYTLARTQNFFDTPMYWPTKANPKPADWKLYRGGAGDLDFMTVYSKK
jgi:hypothetical protein